MKTTACAVLLLVAVGCGKKDDAPDGGDLEAYAAQLKAKVPCEVEKFKAGAWKAEEHTAHPEYPQFFKQLTLKVDPVRLTDKTGKTERYTRARLTLNEPTPTRVPIRGPVVVGDPFEWAKVEMLP